MQLDSATLSKACLFDLNKGGDETLTLVCNWCGSTIHVDDYLMFPSTDWVSLAVQHFVICERFADSGATVVA